MKQKFLVVKIPLDRLAPENESKVASECLQKVAEKIAPYEAGIPYGWRCFLTDNVLGEMGFADIQIT